MWTVLGLSSPPDDFTMPKWKMSQNDRYTPAHLSEIQTTGDGIEPVS
jgi:hypothetical protein